MAADEKEEEKIDLKDRRKDGSGGTGGKEAGWHTDGRTDRRKYTERRKGGVGGGG